MQGVPFLRRARRSQQVSLRLFCFPYAGGSEFVYRTWQDRLPPTIEACPVFLPGRGSWFKEAPLTRMDQLVECLAGELTPHMDIPYALFGHSMGALISFELARLLQGRGAPAPVHLFVAGLGAPQIPMDAPLIYHLPDAEFMAELKEYGGIPQEALENAELMQMMLPVLRADFTACQTYRYQPGSFLSCPVTALGGVEDSAVTLMHLKAWEAHTTGAFAVTMFPDGHFFLRSQEIPLLRKILSQLEATVPVLAPSGATWTSGKGPV